MSEPATLQKAEFVPLTAGQAKVPVQFNPSSLQYTITNTMETGGQGGKPAQFVSNSVGKLTLELVFDTTDTGEDVRAKTNPVQSLMQPLEQGSGKALKRVPPKVKFAWGVYSFQGFIDSYKETLDFFAPSGVPLRSTVQLSMSSDQDSRVFGAETGKNVEVDGGSLNPEAIEIPAEQRNATQVATQGGDPRAGRAVAAKNNQESMRFSKSKTYSVGDSIALKPPIAFATASAGASASAGFGASAGASASLGFGASASAGASFGASAGAVLTAGASAGAGFGVSAGASAGAGFGASAGASAGVGFGASFGAGASAGVSASAGAFAGIRSQATASTSAAVSFDTSKFIRPGVSASVATNSPTGFALGGRATATASAGLSADVGASASLKGKLTFDA